MRMASSRMYTLADRIHGNLHVPSLALEAARQFVQRERRGEWRDDALLFGGTIVPTDRDGNLAIRWSRFKDEAHVVDFSSVLIAGALKSAVPESRGEVLAERWAEWTVR